MIFGCPTRNLREVFESKLWHYLFYVRRTFDSSFLTLCCYTPKLDFWKYRYQAVYDLPTRKVMYKLIGGKTYRKFQNPRLYLHQFILSLSSFCVSIASWWNCLVVVINYNHQFNANSLLLSQVMVHRVSVDSNQINV